MAHAPQKNYPPVPLPSINLAGKPEPLTGKFSDIRLPSATLTIVRSSGLLKA